MSDALDALLDLTREELPADDAFVTRVMADVQRFEQKRTTRRGLRRPMVAGVAAALIVTGGTVAAVVGTNPRPQRPVAPKPTAKVSVALPSQAPVAVTAAPAPQVEKESAPLSPKDVIEEESGFLTDHTAFIRDAKTGLRLQTETYTNEFVVGRDHRVTLTLENTGTKPITFSAAKDCALQVMAFPEGSNSAPVYQSPEDHSGFEWVCAGSDADPQALPFNEEFVLEPGDRRTADAYLNLRTEGEWKIGGLCRCSYTRRESVQASPKSDPLTELFRRALPAPLLPERYEGRNLVTPGIIVRSR